VRWGRRRFGLSGPRRLAGAGGAGATRTTAEAIAAYVDELGATLDIDLNGTRDALTDGLMIVRYLLGVRGSALIQSAIGAGATRNTAPALETYIEGLR
jgi:hypothetical protein